MGHEIELVVGQSFKLRYATTIATSIFSESMKPHRVCNCGCICLQFLTISRFSVSVKPKPRLQFKTFVGIFYIESEEFPCLASIHIEFLEPSEEHKEDENDLALITPFPHKTNPLVLAGCLWMQLSFTTVSCSKPHVPIRTDTHMHPKYTHMLIQIQIIIKLSKSPQKQMISC